MRLLALVVLLALDSGLAAPDGGAGPRTAQARPEPVERVRPEDQEVIDNLELLEHMDESADLDLLQELSVER